MTSFQNRNTMNQVSFCYRNHCDVNMDYYGGGIKDYRKLYAYTLLPDRIVYEIEHPVNGIIHLNPDDWKKMNSISDEYGIIELFDIKERKCLFNLLAMDATFDGKVDVSDLVVMKQRTGTCLDK